MVTTKLIDLRKHRRNLERKKKKKSLQGVV